MRIHFASQTRAKVKQLKTQLRSMKKGSLKMFDYLLKVKSLVDSLAAVGNPIPANDYIEAKFDVLPDEYESVITTVISKSKSYTVDEIEALLLTQESRLEKKVQLQVLDAGKTEASNVTANVAQVKNGGRGSNSGFQNGRGRGHRFFNNRSGRRGGGRQQFQNFQSQDFNQNASGMQKQQQLFVNCVGRMGIRCGAAITDSIPASVLPL